MRRGRQNEISSSSDVSSSVLVSGAHGRMHRDHREIGSAQHCVERNQDGDLGSVVERMRRRNLEVSHSLSPGALLATCEPDICAGWRSCPMTGQTTIATTTHNAGSEHLLRHRVDVAIHPRDWRAVNAELRFLRSSSNSDGPGFVFDGIAHLVWPHHLCQLGQLLGSLIPHAQPSASTRSFGIPVVSASFAGLPMAPM
jgi:hypothetical protein